MEDNFVVSNTNGGDVFSGSNAGRPLRNRVQNSPAGPFRSVEHEHADTREGVFRSTGNSNRRNNLITICLLIVIGAFYVATIRTGHDWGDDFSMYIQHASNIATGAKYAATNYLHVPPFVGPGAYPPVYPLMLAPVYRWFGLNLTAMKIEVILLFLLSLYVVCLAFKSELPWKFQVGIVALMGLSPYFWDLKDQVISDLPFLGLIFLSIYLVHKAYEPNVSGKTKVLYALVIGLVFYLAYGTRSIGIVLLPCLFVYDVVRRRRLSVFVIGVILLTTSLIVLQSVLLRSDRGYYEQLQTNTTGFLYNWLMFMVKNLSSYTRSITAIWDNGYSKTGRMALTGIISAFAIVGYLARLRRRVTFFEIFMVLYPAVVVIAPMEGGVRYLIPLIPLYLFYAIYGVKFVARRKEIENLIFAILLVAIGVSYIAKYTTMNYGTVPGGITKSEAVAVFDYVSANTRPSDVFIFTKPRAFALLTGRKASFYPVLSDDQGWWRYFDRINATHVVVGPRGVEDDDQEWLIRFIGRHQDRMQEVYSNSDFRVYRIRAALPKEVARGTPRAGT